MQEEFEEKPPEKPDWKEYQALARRRRWYFVLPLFLGWLCVWGVSWFLPSVYRSGTLILVEQQTVPQQYVVPNVNPNLQDRLDNITQQILSRTRLLHIIDRLNLYAKYRRRSSVDDLVERMRKDIEIELVRSSEHEMLTAFNIYYSSSDPHLAQLVTRELTNLFISDNLETRQQQSANTTEFLGSQLEQARRDLSEQEARVREFKDRYLGELPGQLQSNLEILKGLQSQFESEEEALNRAKQQNVYLQSLLGQYRALGNSARTGDGVVVGVPSPDQELDRLKAQLADLGSHYTDRHPDVRKLKAQIARAERMKEYVATDLRAKSSTSQNITSVAPHGDANIRIQSQMLELESQLKANEIEIADRQHAVKDLAEKIGGYQARLNRSPVREQQLAEVTRNYDQSQKNYDSLLTKKNESEMATNLEKRQEGEHFRTLDPPSLPTKPYSPNRFKLSWIGLFAGFVLGAGSAAGAEFMDDRVYAEKELKKLFPASVIVEIPPLPTLSEERTQQRLLWLGWTGTGLVFASIIAGVTLSYLHG